MKKFSIKTAERLSGIKAHTLRVWEQRYGLVQPSRSVHSNHREYTNSELKALLKVVYLYHQGYKISDIAKLKNEELEKIIQGYKEQKGQIDLTLMALKEAIIDFNEVEFEDILNAVIRQSGFKFTMLKIIFPLLNQIGLLWMTDKVIPGQEHFASNIIIRKLINAVNQFKISPVQHSGLVMLFTPEGEYHEIPLLFFRYLLMSNGYNTLYLGGSVPMNVVNDFYEKHHPSHLLIHFTSNLQDAEIPDYLTMLGQICEGVQIVVAGAAIRQQGVAMRGIKVLANEAEMLGFCNDIFE